MQQKFVMGAAGTGGLQPRCGWEIFLDNATNPQPPPDFPRGMEIAKKSGWNFCRRSDAVKHL
jgi:hypothetical protein